MPGFTTHYLFGRTVYKTLEQNELKRIIQSHMHAYKLGLQGPDIFFYYLPSHLGGRERKTGSVMHTKKTGEFFRHYIENIFLLPCQDRLTAVSYLCGFLCHYILDANTHPFIYSRSGFHTGCKQNLNACYAKHRILETAIDTVLLKRFTGREPSAFLKENSIRLHKDELFLISSILSQSINSTYHNHKQKLLARVSPFYVRTAVRSLRLETTLLKNKSGRKKKVVEYIEKKTVGIAAVSSLIGEDAFVDDKDCLNERHMEWPLSWDRSIVRNQSFLDLYEKGLAEAKEIVKMLNKSVVCCCQNNFVPEKGELEQLLKRIGNRSYHTGLDCNEIDF